MTSVIINHKQYFIILKFFFNISSIFIALLYKFNNLFFYLLANECIKTFVTQCFKRFLVENLYLILIYDFFYIILYIKLDTSTQINLFKSWKPCVFSFSVRRSPSYPALDFFGRLSFFVFLVFVSQEYLINCDNKCFEFKGQTDVSCLWK